jgi:Lon protease-like protein
MPMFPLGTVLVPGGLLPLQVFEPRYQALVQRCLSTDREFAVVMITRGSEVGGGDLRTDVGTVARIVEAARLVNGRWALRCVGVRRIRVVRWLDDDPYPRAEVVDWPEEVVGTDDELAALVDQVRTRLRQVLALVAELGVRGAPATIDVPDDPTSASYLAVAAGPFGDFDAYTLLTETGPAARLARIARMLDDERGMLAQQLALASELLDPDVLGAGQPEEPDRPADAGEDGQDGGDGGELDDDGEDDDRADRGEDDGPPPAG